MKITHLVFNTSSIEWSAVVEFTNGSKPIHMGISFEMAETLKGRNVIERDSAKHGTEKYTEHMIYFPVVS